MTEQLPEVAKRYLDHSIAEHTVLAARADLRIVGSLLQRGRWLSFSADERLMARVGFHWNARIHLGPLLLTGVDELEGGAARIDFRLFGLIPVIRTSGPDVLRAARGRLAIESMWLPSALHPSLGARWQQVGQHEARITLDADGEDVAVNAHFASNGRLESAWVLRWGDPDVSGTSGLHPFGGRLEDETTFDGYTIPARLRAGWGFGTPGYRESFRFEIRAASFH